MKKKKFKSKVKGVTCTTVGGKEYWYVWMDGVRHPADSQKDAEDARKKFDARKVDAQRTGLDLKTKGAFADFVSMANWYLTVPQVKKLASYDRACGVVANLVNYFGKAPVAAITPARQEDYRDHRREQGAVEATINLEITYLAMIFKLALKRKKIHPHQMPGEFVRATKREVEKESPPRRLITDDEYQRILDHAPQDFRDVCICANETSMRGKEIVTLRVKQIFLDKVVSRVPTRVASILEVMDCKNGMRKAVPISTVLREVLERRIEGLEPEDFVFTRKNGKPWPTRGGYISKQMQRTCEKAGVLYGDRILDQNGDMEVTGEHQRVGVTFHCFRATAITRWIEQGWSDSIIRLASGHKDFESYEKYTKPTDAAVMRLVGIPEDPKNKKPQITANKNSQNRLVAV